MEVLAIEEVEGIIAVEDDGTATFLKEKKRRRVSFAHSDTVHFIPRNDDIETPPLLLNVDSVSIKQNTPIPSDISISGVPASQPPDADFLSASHLHENSADFSQFTCDMDTSHGSWADEDFTTRKNSSFDGSEDDSGCFVHLGHISGLEEDDSIVNDVMNDDMTMDATTFSRNLSHYLKSGTNFGLQGTGLLGQIVSHKNANDSDSRSADDSMALTKSGAPHWALVNPRDVSMHADDEQSDMSLASGILGQVASQKTVNDVDSQSEDGRMACSKPGPLDWALVSSHDVSMHADDDQSDMSFTTGTVFNNTVPICNLKDLLLDHTDYTITRKLSREVDVSTNKILDFPPSNKEVIAEDKHTTSSENADQIFFIRDAMKSKATDADSAACKEAIEEICSGKQKSSGIEEHAMKSKPTDAGSAAVKEAIGEVATTVQQAKQQYSAKHQSSGIEEHAMKSKPIDAHSAAGIEVIEEVATTVQQASARSLSKGRQVYKAKAHQPVLADSTNLLNLPKEKLQEDRKASSQGIRTAMITKDSIEDVANTLQEASPRSLSKGQHVYKAKARPVLADSTNLLNLPKDSLQEDRKFYKASSPGIKTAMSSKEAIDEVATPVQQASPRSRSKCQQAYKAKARRSVLADSTNLLNLPKDNLQEDKKIYKASSQGIRTAISSKVYACVGISGGIGKDPCTEGSHCLEDILQRLQGKTLYEDDQGGEEDMVPLLPTKLQTLGDYLQFSCCVQPQMDWLREHVQELEAKLQAAKKRNAEIKSFVQKLPEESTLVFKTKFASKHSLANKGWLLWKMKPERQILTQLQESKDNLIKEIEAVHGKSQQVLQLKEQVLHLKDSYEEMKSMLKKHHHHYQNACERLRVSKDKWNKIQTKIQGITSVYAHKVQPEAVSFEASFEKNLEALIQSLLFLNSLLYQQQVMQSTLKTNGGKSLIDFSLEGMWSQSFQFEGDGPLAQVKLFRTFHPDAIEMTFPCMDASVFFQYINGDLHSIASVQMEQVYRIIQRTNCLFGCLMDVLKEIRYCRRNFGISCKFQMQKDKLLLYVTFLRCTSGVKVTLMFDMICVKEGMYPSDLKPADIRIETYGRSLNSSTTRREMLARIAKIQPGFARFHRICCCVEELMRTVKETA